MTHLFETARGTVPGTKHTKTGTNNQDGSCLLVTSEATIAVVCDGCSSGTGGSSHNDVGAQIGARILAKTIADSLLFSQDVDWTWVRVKLRRALHNVRYNLMIDLDEKTPVLDYLLFTTLAVVVGKERTEAAAIGDGVVIINGEPRALRPVVKGAPDYIAFELTTRADRPVPFEVVASLPTEELESFFVGTDGCNDLALAADRFVPGSSETIGPLSQFWENDAFYGENHGDELRRQKDRRVDLVEAHQALPEVEGDARARGVLKGHRPSTIAGRVRRPLGRFARPHHLDPQKIPEKVRSHA